MGISRVDLDLRGTSRLNFVGLSEIERPDHSFYAFRGLPPGSEALATIASSLVTRRVSVAKLQRLSRLRYPPVDWIQITLGMVLQLSCLIEGLTVSNFATRHSIGIHCVATSLVSPPMMHAMGTA